ncbi:hypothetical protein PG985_010567 [Apiospora marii]|uniref:uncharacterized protein n=1 Tax=Apiospora marii TaxID=335849 RepID=UPI00312EB04C
MPLPLTLLPRRSVLIVAVAVWLHLLSSGVLGGITFVNPQPEVDNSKKEDWATNIIHPVGSKMTIQWTTDNVDEKGLALLLFQDGRPEADAERIFCECTRRLSCEFGHLPRGLSLGLDSAAREVPLFSCIYSTDTSKMRTYLANVSFYNQRNQWDWTVATSHALTSNAFALALFYEGQTSPAATCRIFNITNPAGSSNPPPSPSSIASQSSSVGPITSSTSQTGSASTTTTPPPSPAAPSDGGGLHDEQKIGLGVGIGVGIPFLALMGFFCFLLWRLSKRQKNMEQPQDQAAAVSGRGSGLYFAGNKQNHRDGRTENHEYYRPYQAGPEELP